MPKDYSLDKMPLNQIRRSERACDDEWIRTFLIKSDVGHIASLWDDQPFITPISFWYDPQTHEIYFHGSHIGRLRANVARNPRVCFEVSNLGKYLPSNVAGEFSLQYESVIVFGKVRPVEDEAQKLHALYGLIKKYFPAMAPGEAYRPITDQESKRTAVFSITIDQWSGKRNWEDHAEQSPEWLPLQID